MLLVLKVLLLGQISRTILLTRKDDTPPKKGTIWFTHFEQVSNEEFERLVAEQKAKEEKRKKRKKKVIVIRRK